MYYPCTKDPGTTTMHYRGVELSPEETSAEIERYPSHLWKDDTHVLPGAEKRSVHFVYNSYERGRYMNSTFYDAV